MNLNWVTGLLVLAVVGVGGYVLTRPAPQQNSFGAASGQNEIVGTDRFIVNGVTRVYIKKQFTAATTTPCSIAAPVGTSTLLTYSYNIITGTSTAVAIDVGTSSSPFSTSTRNIDDQRVVAASALTSYALTPTTTAAFSIANGLAGVYQFTSATTTKGGIQYITLKTGSGLGGFTFGGTCQAVFEVM